MGDTVRDRLDAIDAGAFVGRRAELRRFQDLLRADVPRRQVVWVHGPGGVGKSTLLRAMRRRCRERGRAHLLVDARGVDPSRGWLLSAIAAQLGVATDAVMATLAAADDRPVVMVDTWERLAHLDAWVRQRFVPSLSSRCILVVAGRHAPGPAWRTHPGLRALLVDVPLRNLPPDDSRDLLARMEVPAEVADDVLGFTHGHPLALALVGDVCAQRGDVVVADAALDAIPVLLERLASDATSPAQRAALEAAAVVRVTTEPLLAELLAVDDARDTFAWLRGLGCMELDPEGLRPHEVVRTALATDLRWRNPQRHAELHDRARRHLHARFEEAPGGHQQAVLHDLLFLHRDNPVVAPFFDWNGGLGVVGEPAGESDAEAIVAATRRHEGQQAASTQGHWLAHPAAATTVFRGDDEVLGFVTRVDLSAVSSSDLAHDPVAEVVAAHLQSEAPLRGDEVALLFRSWMSLRDHQAVSTVQGAIFLHVARCYLTTPKLARSYFCVIDGDFWEPVLANFDVARVPDGAFDAPPGVAVFGHDWRVRPPLAWLDLVATRETSRGPVPPPRADEGLVVLSEPDFGAAVRDALRHLHDGDRLARSPLLRSRMVVDRCPPDAGTADRVRLLGDLVRWAARQEQPDPRLARGQRALHHTWLEPVGTQEQAAEALDLPFSTYRRHLGEGLEAVVRVLWRMELGGEALVGA